MVDPEHRFGCQRSEHPHLGRRAVYRKRADCRCLGISLGDLLHVEARAAAPQSPRRRRNPWCSSSSRADRRSTRPGTPSRSRRRKSAASMEPPRAHRTGFIFASICPDWLYGRINSPSFAPCTTPRRRSFATNIRASMYMVQTGRCELPPGETTSTIAVSRRGVRVAIHWFGHRLRIARRAGIFGLPPVIEIPRGTTSRPLRTRDVGSKFGRWRVDLAAAVPDAGRRRLVSPLFQPRPAARPGQSSRQTCGGLVDNSSCRNPDFHLPDLGLSTGLTVNDLQRRATLVADDARRRELDAGPAIRTMDVFRPCLGVDPGPKREGKSV